MPTPASMPTTMAHTLTPVPNIPAPHRPTTMVVVTTINPDGTGGSRTGQITYHGTELTWEDENDLLYIYNEDNGIATHARGTWLNVVDPQYLTPNDPSAIHTE